MRRPVSCLLGLLVAVLLVAGPWGYAHYRQIHIRNFRAVREGVLYRSGQMTITGLKAAVHERGIKTVITLRDSASANEPPPDLSEENYCLAEGLNYVRISPRSWWSPDGSIPAEIGVRRFLEVMDNADNFPVLIHCFAGIHRTGAFCAIYRMEYDRWSNEEAIAELYACGYKYLEDEWDLLDFLKSYVPRWKRNPSQVMQ
jgi:protein tyrosine/serine phosphatase